MSAWIVSKAHVDVLVQAGINEGLVLLSPGTPTAVGRMLWTENHVSVNYRYDETTEVPNYEFRGVEAPLDDVAVIKAISCAEYQSCEHAAWEESEACRYLDNLSERIATRLGVSRDDLFEWARSDHDRWTAAPWGIDCIEQAVA